MTELTLEIASQERQALVDEAVSLCDFLLRGGFDGPDTEGAMSVSKLKFHIKRCAKKYGVDPDPPEWLASRNQYTKLLREAIPVSMGRHSSERDQACYCLLHCILTSLRCLRKPLVKMTDWELRELVEKMENSSSSTLCWESQADLIEELIEARYYAKLVKFLKEHGVEEWDGYESALMDVKEYWDESFQPSLS
jgi:hypothetical protein